MKELKEKIINELKEIFWREAYPQNIIISPIEISCKNEYSSSMFSIMIDYEVKYFLNPIAGEFKNIDGNIYPLEPNHKLNPIIKACNSKSYFYAIPVNLGRDIFEFSENEFFLRVSFISSFVIVEYEISVDENSSIWVVWVFQVLEQNIQL